MLEIGYLWIKMEFFFGFRYRRVFQSEGKGVEVIFVTSNNLFENPEVEAEETR